METIFKINDRVYDGTIGLWGTIIKINYDPIDNYPIDVDFGDNILETYTLDGRKYVDNMPVLSFTEYDLVNGGLSQVRPRHEIKKDQLVYVRIRGEREWDMRYFSHFDKNGELWFFGGQYKSDKTTIVRRADEYSLENPLTSNCL